MIFALNCRNQLINQNKLIWILQINLKTPIKSTAFNLRILLKWYSLLAKVILWKHNLIYYLNSDKVRKNKEQLSATGHHSGKDYVYSMGYGNHMIWLIKMIASLILLNPYMKINITFWKLIIMSLEIAADHF